MLWIKREESRERSTAEKRKGILLLHAPIPVTKKTLPLFLVVILLMLAGSSVPPPCIGEQPDTGQTLPQSPFQPQTHATPAGNAFQYVDPVHGIVDLCPGIRRKAGTRNPGTGFFFVPSPSSQPSASGLNCWPTSLRAMRITRSFPENLQ